MAEDPIRLLFLADSQLGCMATFSGVDAADVERFERRGMRVRTFDETSSLDWDVARYREAVAVANELSPDLLVIGGDMIDDISEGAQLEAFQKATDDLTLDVHYVPGNHDACFDATIPTEESLAWYTDTFGPTHETFSLPVGDRTATFITVNSTLLDQPRKVAGGFDAEMEWLEGALRGAADGPTVLFCHHPPFVDDADEADSYWNIPLERRRPFLDLLAEHHVDLVLSGHRHLNDQATYQGVEIVTSSATGFPLGVDPPGYRMVEITGTAISHTYYGVPDPGWGAIGGPPVPERD